jgi:POT family proton-dependent oligopeptide transporter
MAIGHFMMAFEALFLFALLALILGIGAFKPNTRPRSAPYRRGDQGATAPIRSSTWASISGVCGLLVRRTLAVQYGFHYGRPLASACW